MCSFFLFFLRADVPELDSVIYAWFLHLWESRLSVIFLFCSIFFFFCVLYGCACMCVCVCVRARMCAYVCMYVRVNVRVLCVCMCVYMCVLYPCIHCRDPKSRLTPSAAMEHPWITDVPAMSSRSALPIDSTRTSSQQSVTLCNSGAATVAAVIMTQTQTQTLQSQANTQNSAIEKKLQPGGEHKAGNILAGSTIALRSCNYNEESDSPVEEIQEHPDSVCIGIGKDLDKLIMTTATAADPDIDDAEPVEEDVAAEEPPVDADVTEVYTQSLQLDVGATVHACAAGELQLCNAAANIITAGNCKRTCDKSDSKSCYVHVSGGAQFFPPIDTSGQVRY